MSNSVRCLPPFEVACATNLNTQDFSECGALRMCGKRVTSRVTPALLSHVCVCVCVNIHKYIHIIYIFILYICIHIYIYIYICIYIYIYIYIYDIAHQYTHTNTRMCVFYREDTRHTQQPGNAEVLQELEARTEAVNAHAQ